MIFTKNRLWLAFLIIFLSIKYNSNAQDSSDYIPISELINVLETKNSVTIFYNSNWFEGREVHLRMLSMSLNEVLAEIERTLNISYLFIDDYIVLVPSEGEQEQSVTKTGEVITVGNPIELGRYSKAQIKGFVLDGANQEPLIGAIVYDETAGIGTTTDKNGAYSITLPVGDNKIRLSYLGYEDSYQKVRLIAPGKLDFDLFEKSVHLEGATITAFRKDANIRSTQMSTFRLDPLTLKEMPGAFGERDIIKSFTLLPGVQSVGEFGTGFNVRGGNSDQNLLIIEDMPIFNSSHLFGLVSIVNPDMVTGVTLIKAGIPARYGERASSVVDIRKRGGNPQRTKVTGGIGLLYSRLHLETPLFNRKVFVSLGGRSSYSNWILKNIPDYDLMNSSANFYDFSGVVSFNINSKNSFSLFAYQSQDDFLLSGQTNHSYQSRLGSLRLTSTLSPSLVSRATIGLSQYSNTIEQPISYQPQNAFKMNNSINYETFKWQFDFTPQGVHSYEFGIQAIRYNIDPGKIMPIGTESIIENLDLDPEKGLELAAYASGNFEITSSLSAEIGIRGVWYGLMGPAKVFEYEKGLPQMPENITDTTFYKNNKPVWSSSGLEPRIGLRYLLNDNSSLKISYNRNNQFVNLMSNSSVMAPTDVWRLTNKYTGGLVSNQFAIGYFKLLPDQNIELSVETYFKLIDNIVEYRDGSNILMNPLIETALSNANGYSYGAELYITRKSRKLSGWLSYTWSRSLRRSNEVYDLFKINNNTYFPANFDKPHSLIVNGTYKFTRRWRINMIFTYNTGRPVTYPEQVFEYQGHQAILYSDRNKYRLPDYHRLDLSISYDENLKLNARGKGSWSFSIINVYGRKNAYSVFYKKEEPTEFNNQQRYSLYKLYIIGRPLPTITYNFSF